MGGGGGWNREPGVVKNVPNPASFFRYLFACILLSINKSPPK